MANGPKTESFSKGYTHRNGRSVSDACGEGNHADCREDWTKCACTFRGEHVVRHAYMNPRSPVQVRFDDQYDPFAYKGRIYKGKGNWERAISGRIFVLVRKGWWTVQWGVAEFTGADTAAIGGGAVYYDLVSPWFEDEILALKWMTNELDYFAKKL